MQHHGRKLDVVEERQKSSERVVFRLPPGRKRASRVSQSSSAQDDVQVQRVSVDRFVDDFPKVRTEADVSGFWPMLEDFFLPDEDRAIYAEGLRRGGFLVSVSNLNDTLVEVDRRPVDRPLTDADRGFEDGTVSAEEHHEEALVQKEARVVEERLASERLPRTAPKPSMTAFARLSLRSTTNVPRACRNPKADRARVSAKIELQMIAASREPDVTSGFLFAPCLREGSASIMSSPRSNRRRRRAMADFLSLTPPLSEIEVTFRPRSG